MKRNIPITIAFIWLSSSAMAADIASGARTGTFSPDSTDGGYFEIGAGISHVNSKLLSVEDFSGLNLGVVIGGEYRYKGLFVESTIGSADGLNLGFNLYSNEGFSLDFLASSVSGTLSDDDDDLRSDQAELERNAAISKRDTFYNGAGFRLTAYTPDENRIVQFRLVSDIHDGNGLSATLRTSKTHQWKNWVFHSIFSLGYLSRKTSQYFYGVDANVATEQFQEFNIGSTWTFGVEAGATYPINENWVFRATVRGGVSSSKIQKSPLVSDNAGSSVAATVTYVF